MVTVRPATPADGPAFLGLVRALADFEQLDGPSPAACERLLADAFGERPRFALTVAEQGGEVVGYAVTFETYSTFRARPTLFLEDLYVAPAARRRGVASALLAYLRERAASGGYGRFEWMVLDWNEGAQRLYERAGAERLGQWVLYRVTLP